MSLFEELKRRNVVRMAALYIIASWLILQIADVLFDALELPPVWVRLVLAVLILGFPLALIFSWVFEMTPEGIKREKDVDRSQSVTHSTGRKINVVIIVLLVMAMATVALDRLVPETTIVAEQAVVVEAVADKQSVDDKSIAVLPFANRSAREEDVFFVDGIHDDILTQLARVGSLTVISRTSVERFRDLGPAQSMKEIGAILGVKNILEGGVQRAGDRVRINVQLIDVTTDAHLWADSYDRELTTSNIFAIQSEISTAIATALEATLSPEEKTQLADEQTQSMAALEAFFLGRQALEKRTNASITAAEQHFKRAIALDAEYSLALVGLADTYNLQTIYSGRTDESVRELAIPLVDKALAINDRLGEAYIAKAMLTEDEELQEMLFKKGIALAPGYASGYQWYGNILTGLGRTSDALLQLEQAARLDPLSGIIGGNLGSALEAAGRFDEARARYEAVLRNNPGFAVAYFYLAAMAWSVDGRLDDAIVKVRRAAKLDPGNPTWKWFLAQIWSDIGAVPESLGEWKAARIAGLSERDLVFSATILKRNSGDLAEAVGDAEVLLALDPDSGPALLILGINDLRAGQVGDAVERYRAALPSLSDGDNPVVDATNYTPAINLAFLLQKTGDQAQADLLLTGAGAVIEGLPRLGLFGGYAIDDVRIHALRGNKVLALAALRRAVDEGWRVGWQLSLKYDPILEPLHDEPEYQEILAEVEADMAVQLKRVREIVANDDE